MEKYDTIIFDFDGTLINSERYNKLAYCKVLSHIMGKEVTLTNRQYERYIGKKDVEIYEMFKKDFNIDFDTNAMVIWQAEIARDILIGNSIPIHDYFFEVARRKGNKHFYIVSNHNEIGLFPIVERKKIAGYFDKVFCLPIEKVSKDYFYKNIKQFIPDAKNVIVFEDSLEVLNSLTSMGYPVVAIEHDLNSSEIHGKFENIIKV